MTREYINHPNGSNTTDRSRCYFAYGSNLNADDLRGWCERKRLRGTPLGRCRGVARLPDRELCFNYYSDGREGGALNLRQRTGQIVEGVLFEVDTRGRGVLDQKEGAPRYYERVPVHVFDDEGRGVEAFTYTVVQEDPRGFVKPTPAYVEIVREGLKAFGLCSSQLDAAAADAPVPLALDGVFVYGTLMRCEERSRALAKVADLECTLLATTRGCLLDLGAYPALVRDPDGCVDGEFLRVRNMRPVLDLLDSIEGFDGYHAGSLYHRVLTTADVGDGRLRPAWTYVLAHAGNGRPVIASGNWRKHRGRHDAFMQALFDAHCAGQEVEITNDLARRVPFSMAGEHDEAVRALTPLVGAFMQGAVSERRLAQRTGKWVCVPMVM